MKRGFIVLAVLALILTGCGGGVSQAEYDKVVSERDALKEQLATGDQKDASQESKPKKESESESAVSSGEKELSLGDTFEFDDLEITFGSEITWRTLDNQFSDKNGADVFSIPITIKNIKNETHGLNIFYYDQYGPKGVEIDDVSSFFDNDISDKGKIRSGAELSAIMHFLYDGDGDYYVEFDNYGQKVEVKISVAKS